ncbi:MAG TPA: metalloregulator ArsR/SmtB family transcription factor [Croceibacterium sp.]|nr:metalloregulator ArsR/SmtB family transcription factor [Croceibacterium sp.]
MHVPLALDDLTANSAAAAELLRALSSEPRLLVMCHLAAAGELSAGQLGERIGLSQSALSQHLAKLREQGLVAYRREAQSLHYRVVDPNALRLLQLLHELFCPGLDLPP